MTFKLFLEQLMNRDLFAKLITAAASRTPRMWLYCDYDGVLHEGIIDGAQASPGHGVPHVTVNYRKWSADENTFIPADLYIYEEDLPLFYFGKDYEGRKALLCSSKKSLDEEREIYAKKLGDVPEWAPQHAEESYRIGDVTFSASKGLGSVPGNANVWYEGFVATMTPSTFLTLATDDQGYQEPTSKELEALVKEGYALGIPFLSIKFDEEGNELPRITGHEGRGRMRMLRRVLGDVPVPVHFFLRGGLRSRHLTPEMTDEVKLGVFAEQSNRLVRRPVVDIWVNGKKI